MVSFLTSPLLTSCAESRPTNSKDNCFIAIQINQFKQLKTYVKSWGSFNILGIERPVKLFKRLWELEGA